MEAKAAGLAMTPPGPGAGTLNSPLMTMYRSSPYSEAGFHSTADWSPRDEDAAMALVTLPASPFRCMTGSPSAATLTPSRIGASPMAPGLNGQLASAGLETMSPLTPSLRLKDMTDSPFPTNGGSLAGTPLGGLGHTYPFGDNGSYASGAGFGSPSDKGKVGDSPANSSRLRQHYMKNLHPLFPGSGAGGEGEFAHEDAGRGIVGTPTRRTRPAAMPGNGQIVITPRKGDPRKSAHRKHDSPSSFKLEIDPESPVKFVKAANRINRVLNTPTDQRAGSGAAAGPHAAGPAAPRAARAQRSTGSAGISPDTPASKASSAAAHLAAMSHSSETAALLSLGARTGRSKSSKAAPTAVIKGKQSKASTPKSVASKRRGATKLAAHSQPATSHAGAATARVVKGVPAAQRSQSTGSSRRGGRKSETGACNCKKSKCLKLYCECFAAKQECRGCNCQNCHNNAAHATLREQAIKNTLSRNANAFKPKIGEEGIAHSKGCHCKKSGCKKKYCECFQAQILCGAACKCKACENTADGTVVDRGGDDSEAKASPRSALKASASKGHRALTKGARGAKALKAPTSASGKIKAEKGNSLLSPGLTPLHTGAYNRKRDAARAFGGAAGASAGEYAMLPNKGPSYRVFGPRNPKLTEETVVNIFSFLRDDDLGQIMPVSKMWGFLALHKSLWVAEAEAGAGDNHNLRSGSSATPGSSSPVKKRSRVATRTPRGGRGQPRPTA